MSIDSINPDRDYEHEVRHDLESLFYVMIWICTTQCGPNNMARSFEFSKTELYIWNAGGRLDEELRNIWDAKAHIISGNDLELFEERVLKKMDDYFNPIKDCIVELKEVLFPSSEKVSASTSIPEAFIEVLDNTIHHLMEHHSEPFVFQTQFIEFPSSLDSWDDMKNTLEADRLPHRAMDVKYPHDGKTALAAFDDNMEENRIICKSALTAFRDEYRD